MNEPIAIVGIAAEFPSGEHTTTNLGHEAFHDFLMQKKDAYETIPAERMNIEAWTGHGLGKTTITRGAFLKSIGQFDAAEFGVTAKDARAMAVGTRRLIELSFLALLDSGIDYRGHNIGCFSTAPTYDIRTFSDTPELESAASLASSPCMVANKISYHLDLRGPSVPVDTACSSTAVALHMAVQEIRAGACEAAVVAGCQVNLRASEWTAYSQAGIAAPDGICKPFDEGGNGFSRGEGAAVLVLKPLAQALKDGDYVYGSILGTGVTSCGSLGPVSAPVPEAQAAAMLQAYKGTGRTPKEVDFVEVHGTGTAAGDPAEANWVGQHFGGQSRELVIGSVKGNIGHLEIASFVAQISKVCSIFRTNELPPQAHLKTLNPAIRWEEYNMRTPRAPESLFPRAASGKHLVSICSSGIGGVNVHVVLEGVTPPAPPPAAPSTPAPVLLVAGGQSPRSVATVAEDIVGVYASCDDATAIDVSVALGRRARPLTWRSIAVRQPGGKIQFSAAVLRPRVAPPIAFLFSGQGPQHINMGRQLFEAYPVFRKSILELDECHKKQTGLSFITDFGLFTSAPHARVLPTVWPISLILPSVTVIQLALFDLLVSLGLRPDVLIGHSAGETALVYASGAGSKEMALEIAIARAIAMTVVEEQANGTMAALSCSPVAAEHIIKQIAKRDPSKVIEIACFNSPDAVALAGDADLLDLAMAVAKKGGIMGRKIMTSVPVHSSLMDVCADKFKELVGDVFARYPGSHRPTIPTYSTCTGHLLDEFTAQYFWDGTRSPVLFTSTMGELLERNANTLFVEVGAHPVLSSYVAELGVASASISPMRRSKEYVAHQEQTTLLTAIGQAVVAGYSGICFNTLNGRPRSTVARPALPAYPFAKKAVDIFPEYSRLMHRTMCPRNGPLNYPDMRINVATHPELAGHMINSEPIMPAAGFVEMAFELGAKSLWNVRFHSILSLSAPTPTPVDIVTEGKYFAIKSHVTTGKYFNYDTSSHRLHADGYFTTEIAPRPADIDISTIRKRLVLQDLKDFYEGIGHFAHHGPTYRRMDELYLGGGGREILSRVRALDIDIANDGAYIVHPAIMDASLQGGNPRAITDPNVYYLPERVNSMFLYETLNRDALSAGHIYCYATFRSWTPAELTYDAVLTSGSGQVLLKMEGYVIARHLQVPEELTMRYELLYRPFGTPVYTPKDEGSGASLQDTCTDYLRRAVAETTKPDLRILEFQSDSTLASLSLESIETGVDTVMPTFFIVSDDTKSIKPDALPQYSSVLALGSLVDLDMQIVDVVIVPENYGVDSAVLKRLRTAMVPGGLLAWSTTSIEATTIELSRGGFINTYISNGNEKQSPVVYSQAPVLPTELPAERTPKHDMNIITYAVGNEMAIKAPLSELDDTYHHPIWLVTGEGPEGIDTAAMQGFGRSLRREHPSWNIRLATFASCYSEADHHFIIDHFLPKSGMEFEFLVEADFCIKVPRICPSPDPRKKEGSIERSQVSVIPQDEILLTVSQTSFSETGTWVVIGSVTAVGAGSNEDLIGKAVLTVTTVVPADAIRVSKTAVTVLPEHLCGQDRQALADCISPLVFFLLAVGDNILANPAGLNGRLIITEDEFGGIMLALCKSLGLRHAALSSTYSAEELSKLQLNVGDIILTASDPKDQLFSCYVPQETQVSSWTIPSNIFQSNLHRQPGFVCKAVTAICGFESLPSLLVARSAPLIGPIAPTPQMFSADKSYILIGGVGSVGPYIAVWMYQNGARDIILTSRSGRGTLDKLQDALPGRVFDYLETVSDLNLYVEAVDGSDPTSMINLVGSLRKPLGGAIMLAAVWDDRLFLDQDEESFARSFKAKVGSLRALEAATDVASLDFVVSMSTGTMFGSHGQTNYTSANTALDGLLKKYPNTFSIATPLVHDTVIATQFAANFSQWGCSPTLMCRYIEDGLRKLADGPLNIYIPLVNFDNALESLGPSLLYDHLTRKTRELDMAGDDGDLATALTPLLLHFIDVSLEDFSTEVPFTAYGLDSLSAGRLSIALRPWILISQMQLLADMAMVDLERRITAVRAAKAEEVDT